MPLSDSVQQALQVVSQEEAGLQARRDQLMAQVDEIDNELAVYKRIRRAAEPPEPKAAKAKSNGATVPLRPKTETITRVWEALKAHPDLPAGRLAEYVDGAGHDAVRRAVYHLRAEGYAIATRTVVGGGHAYAPAPDAPETYRGQAIPA